MVEQILKSGDQAMLDRIEALDPSVPAYQALQLLKGGN
jgi:hypothetical protein